MFSPIPVTMRNVGLGRTIPSVKPSAFACAIPLPMPREPGRIDSEFGAAAVTTTAPRGAILFGREILSAARRSNSSSLTVRFYRRASGRVNGQVVRKYLKIVPSANRWVPIIGMLAHVTSPLQPFPRNCPRGPRAAVGRNREPSDNE